MPEKPFYTLDSVRNITDAMTLARMIEQHWEAKGAKVKTTVDRIIMGHSDNNHFAIRSNLVGGLPPRES